jgi:hypothetical protein
MLAWITKINSNKWLMGPCMFATESTRMVREVCVRRRFWSFSGYRTYSMRSWRTVRTFPKVYVSLTEGPWPLDGRSLTWLADWLNIEFSASASFDRSFLALAILTRIVHKVNRSVVSCDYVFLGFLLRCYLSFMWTLWSRIWDMRSFTVHNTTQR